MLKFRHLQKNFKFFEMMSLEGKYILSNERKALQAQ